MSNVLSGPAVRSLTRPSATLSQRARVRWNPLSLWERGWGEGKTAGPVNLQHTSQGGKELFPNPQSLPPYLPIHPLHGVQMPLRIQPAAKRA